MRRYMLKKYMDAEDDTLVERTLLGDGDAYEALVLRHEKAVKGTAFRVTGNQFSAEDAAQDAFVTAWMKLDSLRERERFGAWVCSIAKNCARNLVAHYHAAVPDISLDLLENTAAMGSDESGLAKLYDLAQLGEQER
ncbi:MAG: RNA polymerase sigma factor, partial [Eubacteriales bacterium]